MVVDSQLRRGILEFIVLASLTQHPDYGGSLLDSFHTCGLDMSSGTLYPLLTRLKKTGSITSHWEESPAGPPRKIYTVTTTGQARARSLAQEWRQLSTIVDHYLKGLQP